MADEQETKVVQLQLRRAEVDILAGCLAIVTCIIEHDPVKAEILVRGLHELDPDARVQLRLAAILCQAMDATHDGPVDEASLAMTAIIVEQAKQAGVL